jgi:hypothetical protein
MPKPIKTPRVADPVIPGAQGPWLMLIGAIGTPRESLDAVEWRS